MSTRAQTLALAGVGVALIVWLVSEGRKAQEREARRIAAVAAYRDARERELAGSASFRQLKVLTAVTAATGAVSGAVACAAGGPLAIVGCAAVGGVAGGLSNYYQQRSAFARGLR
jgi:hypothetical protein